MGVFEETYNKIMEQMVSGGSGSVLGTPVNAPEIGSTGGSVGNVDSYPNDARWPFRGRTQSRKGIVGKRKKNK